MILDCIASLLAASSPVAVVMEIPKAAISSFDAVVCRGRFAHVCVEVLKGQPTLTNRYSFGSVSIVSNMVMVVASLNHATPSPEDRQVGESVCGHSFAKSLSLVATTTDDVTFAQVSATVNGLASTFAMAKPVCSQLGPNRGKCQDRQFSEGFPCQVFNALGDGARLLVSHVNLRNRFNVVRIAKAYHRFGCSYFSSLAIAGQR